MANLRPISVGVLVGVLAGGAYYAGGQWDQQLLLFLVLTWGVAGWLLARNRHTIKHADILPQILFAGLVVGIPLYSIHPELPLGDLRMTLVLHMMGIAAAGVGLGTEMGESPCEEQSTSVADTD